MNKKGFTLIELMSVIALILIIMTSLVLIVSRMANNNKKDLYEAKVALLEIAAKEYGEDYINELSDECTYVSVGDLLDLEYIKSDERKRKIIIDPRTNESMNDMKICLTYDGKVNASLFASMDDSTNGNDQYANLYNLMKNNALTTAIDFKVNSGESGTNGIYTTTETDSGSPVYYYRGSYEVLNNNLIFNNFCWKIIRTTETGGVKIIYNGTPTDGKCETQTGRGTQLENTSSFNANYNDNAYVGYMYGTAGSSTYADTHANTTDSAIKKKVDEWYENNMTNVTNKLEDTVFCNDRSTKAYDANTIGDTILSSYKDLGYGTNATLYGAAHRASWYSTNPNPTLKCTQANDKFTVGSTNGNGKLTYPVGLITLDEVVFAGFNTKSSNTNNYEDSINYLYTNRGYWTLSPSSVGTFGSAAVGYVYSDGGISQSNANVSYGIRPAVSLADGTLVESSGDGSTTNPYVVK